MSYYKNIQADLELNPKTWLITGVAGFIGSNLLEKLLSLNQRVIGLDNLSTGYEHNLDLVKSLVTMEQWGNFSFIEGDICNINDCIMAMNGLGSDNLSHVCKKAGIVNYVLHHAALGSVPRSIYDPVQTNKNNIDGFLNILVASRDAGVERFIYAASSSTYGDHQDLPKVEEKIGRPLSPYAVTKLANELYADVFSRCYNISCIGLRYFNVFGRRQDPEGAYAAVIPKWTSSILHGEDVYINGDGQSSRDFCYIDNVVQANILAATTKNAKAINQIYNVAVGEQTSLNQLYSMIKNYLSFGDNEFPSKLIYRSFRDGDVRHSLANIDKAKKLLGYQPEFRVRDAIELVVAWYKDELRNVR